MAIHDRTGLQKGKKRYEEYGIPWIVFKRA